MSEETNIFSIRAQKTKYSKYAFSLDRLFKNNSLNCLQEKLRNPVYYKPKEEKIDDGFKQLKAMRSDKDKANLMSTIETGSGEFRYGKRKGKDGSNNKSEKEDREVSYKEAFEAQRHKR